MKTLRLGKKPPAVVVALDGMNGIQTARILARRGVPVFGIAKDPKNPACRTNACRAVFSADLASDDLIRTLGSLGPRLGQKAVLVPCTDVTVLNISRNRARLAEWYHIALPDAEMVEMLVDKVGFYTYAQEKGFPIPPTFFLRGRADAEHAAGMLRFPCVIKPPVSAIPGWEKQSKLKAYIISSPEEFLSAYDRLCGLSPLLIAQEWIEGPISNLYSCNCYYNAQSEPLVNFIARKIRQWPPETGESSLGEECRNDVVLDVSNRLFSSVRYRGLGYLEMKKSSRTGEHFIMEPNVGRPTGRSAIAEAGGVELLYTMYCDALGWPLPPDREQRYGHAKWISIRRDLQSSFYWWRRGQLTVGEWWRSIRGRKVDAYFSWSDLRPFWSDLVRAVRLYLVPTERKKRDFSKPLT